VSHFEHGGPGPVDLDAAPGPPGATILRAGAIVVSRSPGIVASRAVAAGRRVPRGQWDLDICPAPANRHGNLSSPGVAPVAVAPASADRYAPGAHGTDRSEG